MASVIAQYINRVACTDFCTLDQTNVAEADGFKKRRVAGFSQPRGDKLPSLISEFGSVIKLNSQADISQRRKLLRYDQKGGELDEQFVPVVGVFRDPASFVSEAKNIIHPLDRSDSCDPLVLSVLLHTLASDPSDIARQRVVAIKQLVKLVEHTKTDNIEALSVLPDGMKRVLHGGYANAVIKVQG